MEKRLTRPTYYSLIVAALLAINCAGQAKADALGELWQNVGAASAALISNQPATPPDAEFLTPAINYNSNITGYTAATFFLNPTFFNTSANFNADTGFYGPDGSMNNAYVLFTGETPLTAGDNTFVMSHDDGFELSIPSLSFDYISLGVACCSGFDTFTVNAPTAGDYSFVLSYGEAYGAPASLAFAIDDTIVSGTSTPEPATFWMFGSVCIIALLIRRRATRRQARP
jgi:hypothetical protein